MTGPDKAERARLQQQAMEERAALAQRLQSMPLAMRQLPQWLVWKLIEKPGSVKPAKVPFYVNGQLRGWPKGKPRDGVPTDRQPQVEQGHELDRAHLVTLDEALIAFGRSPQWAGVGFAFLPGDGLIGVDIDGAVDPATGEVSELCTKLVAMCASYTEASPSGKGVHIILAGESPKFKDDAIGLEVYAGGQYFTCTGRSWPGMPAEVVPADPLVMAYMRELVDESKARQAAAKEAERAAAAAAAPPPAARPAAAGRHAAPGQQTNDFKLVNDAAYQQLAAWVPRVLPDAKRWGAGYRISSKALGRDLQEDLQLLPEGIMDFGEEQGLSPIDVVMKWQPGCATPKDALHWLAGALGITLRSPMRADRQPPPPGRDARPGAQQPGEGERGAADGEEPPPWASASADDVATDEPAAADGGGRKKIDPKVWAQVEEMLGRYALVYGTDTVWDRTKLKLVRIPALRLAWGKTPVGIWLSRDGRDMVDAEDLVFEPDVEVEPPRINMWAGLDLRPVVCEAADVDPMLQLLRHLCDETRIVDADGKPVGSAVDDVMHWMLCWQAFPLQYPGTKLATALVMHGAQGTGKNLYFDAWRDLYGSYGITVTQTELEDKYNGWISRKLAVVGDEVVSRAEMYHNKNRLKLIVTQRDKFAIRDLFTATRWESNHANVVFLSNESEPLVLEDRDRRFLVIYTPLDAPADLYARVRDFLADGGLAKWMDYLLNYDLGDFDPHTKPPFTEAKRALIEANWRSSVRFVNEWLEGLLELPQQVCSAEQLYRAFRHWCEKAGERWPPSQSKFTTEVNRWVSESRRRGADGAFPPLRLTYKPVALAETSTKRKTVRCFIPMTCKPPDGVSEGAWAWDAVRAFENELWKFMGRRQSAAEEES